MNPPDARLRTAAGLMADFCRRTGVGETGSTPRRYLWTDAFAVCNLLGLAEADPEGDWLSLALELIHQVHDVLGRERPGTPDRPHLGGVDEATVREHPTRHGLRIGKPLDERRPDEPFDERREWDRDGQYFHYLTKWMHALARAAEATGEVRFARWGIELAQAAHRAFRHRDADGRLRLYWKMSIDLSRPLVPSMGQHDALDAWVVYEELAYVASRLHAGEDPEALSQERIEAWEMLTESALPTADPLGIGGLLMDATLHGRMILAGGAGHAELLAPLLQAAQLGLEHFLRSGETTYPPHYRLAFRELGLAIGLHGAALLRDWQYRSPDDLPRAARTPLQALTGRHQLARELEQFWLAPENQEADIWREHLDINAVMLATSLAPQGFYGSP